MLILRLSINKVINGGEKNSRNCRNIRTTFGTTFGKIGFTMSYLPVCH